MEDSLFNKQEPIWTSSHIFWIVQFARNFSKDNKQYLLRIIIWRSASQLHEQIRNSSKDNEGTRRMNNSIFEDSREIQSVFQTVKIQF